MFRLICDLISYRSLSYLAKFLVVSKRGILLKFSSVTSFMSECLNLVLFSSSLRVSDLDWVDRHFIPWFADCLSFISSMIYWGVMIKGKSVGLVLLL